ncbi:MAG: hypothetical protein BMS9Abin06_0125 [Gammaproteobacteria bacterium]|nr:MAG: hypothetical protein BMS9Abin06_0125 [Gammaproteobacteria bacterium]
MDTFTVRDLRERTGKLIRNAESGELAVVTKHGKPIFVAVPFSEEVVTSGVLFVLATRFFQDDLLSLGKAARFAGCSTPEFIDYLGKIGIPSVHYPAEGLEQELEAIG